MNTVEIKGPGVVVNIESDIPNPQEEEVLIQVNYVGFCGSDLSTYLGKNPMVNYPVVPGHEIAGVIKALGSKVPRHIEKGDSVTVNPYTSCGECPSCRSGRTNACQFNQTMGVQRNGAMSEYIAVPWQKVLKAQGLSMKELALIEPLTVGFHATSRGRINENDNVVVLGCGMIGMGALISASNLGASVIAIDIDDKKLKLAKKLGASYTINTTKEDVDKKLLDITNNRGPDIVIEAAGQKATYLAAIRTVAFTGRVVCIGYAKEEIGFATKLFVQKELDILGSRNATSEDFRNVINYLSQGILPVEDIISKVIKPRDANSALMEWANDTGKVLKILVDFTAK